MHQFISFWYEQCKATEVKSLIQNHTSGEVVYFPSLFPLLQRLKPAGAPTEVQVARTVYNDYKLFKTAWQIQVERFIMTLKFFGWVEEGHIHLLLHTWTLRLIYWFMYNFFFRVSGIFYFRSKSVRDRPHLKMHKVRHLPLQHSASQTLIHTQIMWRPCYYADSDCEAWEEPEILNF